MTDSIAPMDFNELEESILFEDESLVVLNKPAGWVVNRSATYTELTVQDWMEERLRSSTQETVVNTQKNAEADEASPYGTPEEIFKERGGIVHRLDKDTSGILLLAKTPTVLVELLRQFRERAVAKTYIALIHGKLAPTEGIIRLPMGRSDKDHGKFAIAVDGKLSETHYLVVEYFPGNPKGMSEKKGKSYQGFSLVTLRPKTGRTHQIRVHMAALKHPIVSDGTYAGHKRIALDREWCPRQFLHATAITFTHPRIGEQVSFEAPLAPDLQKALEFFDQSLSVDDTGV